MNSTESDPPTTVHLRDYRPAPWRIDHVALEFDLDPHRTRVVSRLQLRQDPQQSAVDLRLDGICIELLEVRLDGRTLDAGEYRIDACGLEIPCVRGRAIVETVSIIDPAANSGMRGLYLSGGADSGFLLSQCEAEGFRHITWSIDRPDVLATHEVTLRADRDRFPVLLAGGNPDGSGELDRNRHWARFVDPQPRPSYLFALVAGALDALEDSFVTAEGRRVRLVIWAERDSIARCVHAMDCLKAAFAWDEREYGRCYQLEVFHVVATHDFTMGAMENTGLNIFNAKYLLADPLHATDEDYRHVLAVVGHEYFHNWTGNRVTCRDWFQLSLKEGLTVFREQEFESDVASRTLRRIEDVRTLWRTQFNEDAGPLAHPVRPQHYREINNFYTATVYDKGAEIVRMLATLLGRDGFRRGMDLYFARHDGQAVTVEDFLAALGDANEIDLGAWLIWYTQAGTPVVSAHGQHDPLSRSFLLTLGQHVDATPGQAAKAAVPIPIAVALFDHEGRPLAIELEGEVGAASDQRVVLLDTPTATFRFRNLASAPVCSLLRGYSAPVRMAATGDWHDLVVLAAHESDGFNRWHAADALSRQVFADILDGRKPGGPMFEAWAGALRLGFDDTALDPATLAEMLTVADESSLVETRNDIDPDAVHAARLLVESSLARALENSLIERYDSLADASTADMGVSVQARRRLRNRCMTLLCQADRRHLELARTHYARAQCLSDRLAALTCLVHGMASDAQRELDDFAEFYADDPNVMAKWLSVQATAAVPDAPERVHALTTHASFRWENPNKVYALVLGFATRNPSAFHRADGAGYRLVADAVRRIDAIVPQVAARLATPFADWRRLEWRRRGQMQATVRALRDAGPLSPDVSDILDRGFGED